MNTSTTQITLRGVDESLNQIITQNARKKGQSKNAYLLDILRERLDQRYNSNGNDSWRKFAGAIPDDGLNQDVLDDFEKIDETMWR